jgi:hypothetical protein
MTGLRTPSSDPGIGVPRAATLRPQVPRPPPRLRAPVPEATEDAASGDAHAAKAPAAASLHAPGDHATEDAARTTSSGGHTGAGRTPTAAYGNGRTQAYTRCVTSKPQRR